MSESTVSPDAEEEIRVTMRASYQQERWQSGSAMRQRQKCWDQRDHQDGDGRGNPVTLMVQQRHHGKEPNSRGNPDPPKTHLRRPVELPWPYRADRQRGESARSGPRAGRVRSAIWDRAGAA